MLYGAVVVDSNRRPDPGGDLLVERQGRSRFDGNREPVPDPPLVALGFRSAVDLYYTSASVLKDGRILPGEHLVLHSAAPGSRMVGVQSGQAE